ncbi:MAG TPA: hypothetical protein VLG39_03555, partial [Nitrospirota bacterium]|nr:hypothetical protein [Nitrospirota bacterium]
QEEQYAENDKPLAVSLVNCHFIPPLTPGSAARFLASRLDPVVASIMPRDVQFDKLFILPRY